MKRNLIPVLLLAAIVVFSIGTFSSCEKVLICPAGKVCPDDTPYWGGGSLCYASKAYCEDINEDECIDCTD